MYEPFEQEHAQSQQVQKGTGLGLSVARQLIDLFGGMIHVESPSIRKLPHPDAARIPIIALSANAFAEDVEESRAAGMDAHLTKPADATVMLTTLSRLITKGRPVFPPPEPRG